MNSIYEPHASMNKELPFLFYHSIHHNKGVCNWHENIEILYVTEGEGEVICGNQIHAIKKGDVVAINSYTLHMVKEKGHLKLCCLIIDREYSRKNGIDTSKYEFETIIQGGLVEGKIQRIITEYAEKQDFYVTAIKSAVLDLLVYLCRNHSRCKETLNKEWNSVYECVQFALGYMEANYDKKLTVDILSEKVGLSKYYFSREFKRITGYTIIHYLNIVRCLHAKNLLAEARYSVREAACLCGFENASYFSKVFKNIMGALPSEYEVGSS